MLGIREQQEGTDIYTDNSFELFKRDYFHTKLYISLNMYLVLLLHHLEKN